MLPTKASEEEARAVAARLSGGGLYVRTALLLLTSDMLGREGELAARLNIGHLNYHTWKVGKLRPAQTFLMYSAERLLTELGDLCAEPNAHSTVLISNFDLPLAALSASERRKFWNFMYSTFSKRPRAMLLTMPQHADVLLPDETSLAEWQSSGRLSSWPS